MFFYCQRNIFYLKGQKKIPHISQGNRTFIFSKKIFLRFFSICGILFRKKDFAYFSKKSEKYFFEKKYTSDFLGKSEVPFLFWTFQIKDSFLEVKINRKFYSL